jgi:hypothetical protein
MKGLPLLTAVSSLPVRSYVGTVGERWGTPVVVGPVAALEPGEPDTPGCSPYWLAQCLARALRERDDCDRRIRGGWGGPPGTGGPQPISFCTREYDGAVAVCRSRRGCPAGWTCGPDVREAPSGGWRGPGPPIGDCCPPNKEFCFNTCVDPCPAGKVHGQFCACTCPQVIRLNGCDAPFVLDEETCTCGCPPVPCLEGTINPRNCQCECPEGKILCNGRCVDLKTNRQHCGRCNNACTPLQDCCDGQCTYTCTDTDCSKCGDRVPAGFKCCDCTPVQLGTDAHCADCSPCTGDRTCVDGSCQCKPGTRLVGGICCANSKQCCNDAACAPGTRCCNGTCVNVSTNAQHCGSCNSPCPSPRVCISGTCQCPQGTTACGPTACCQPNQACCNGSCCNPSQSCVDAQRNSVTSTDPSGRCGCLRGEGPCFGGCCSGTNSVCAGANPWAPGLTCCSPATPALCPPIVGFPNGRCCAPGAANCCV